jgi:hypothetical protein
VAPGRPTPRASPPVPLVRVTGHQRLRGRHCHLFLLRPHGRGHGAGRLACRCHARRRCGALFERRPIVRDVLSFSALTGARSGTAGDALTMKQREEISGFVSKSRACGKECYSPNIKSLTSSSSRAGEHLHCARWRLRGARRHLHRQPGGGRLCARLGGQFHGRPSDCGDGGAGSHLSEVVRSPPRPTTSSPAPAEGRALAARAASTPRFIAQGALAA